ncbi:hypothetical protein SHIRM173S_00098 [Streptomyces hirsutus]
MVLTEVLQNALEHGFREGDIGTVEVTAVRGGTTKEARLLVTVQDDGVGLPEDFDPHTGGNLGLHIVRTLVEGEWAERSTWCRRGATGCHTGQGRRRTAASDRRGRGRYRTRP